MTWSATMAGRVHLYIEQFGGKPLKHGQKDRTASTLPMLAASLKLEEHGLELAHRGMKGRCVSAVHVPQRGRHLVKHLRTSRGAPQVTRREPGSRPSG